ncbi:MAG: hypothetical protein AAGH68_02100 [Pseudomonadota bacterium]
MTDQKKPEAIADEDLDTAQGGFKAGLSMRGVKGVVTLPDAQEMERDPGARKVIVATGDGSI